MNQDQWKLTVNGSGSDDTAIEARKICVHGGHYCNLAVKESSSLVVESISIFKPCNAQAEGEKQRLIFHTF